MTQHAPGEETRARLLAGGRLFDAEIDGVDASERVLDGLVLEDCTVRSGRFVATRVVRGRIVSTRFEDCDLTAARLAECALHEVRFVRCRLRSVDFTLAASLRALAFEECVLDGAGFAGLELPGLVLSRGSAREALFEDARLRGADLRGADLTGAVFAGADLRGADLRDARGYAFDPRAVRVAGLRVSLPEGAALLAALGIRFDALDDA